MYIEKDAKLEDNKTTASTFLLVGGIGLIVIILYAADIIKLPLSDYMRMMVIIVMSILFLIFISIGLIHLSKTKKMTEEAERENRLTEEITSWFMSAYNTSEDRESEEDVSLEQLYFIRYEQMKALLHTKYENLPEDYEEHLLETLYDDLYPEKI